LTQKEELEQLKTCTEKRNYDGINGTENRPFNTTSPEKIITEKYILRMLRKF
jgi:hypothetical protein